MKVKGNVPLNSNGSFSVPAADLNKLLELTCQLKAVPAGKNPADLTPFSGPVDRGRRARDVQDQRRRRTTGRPTTTRSTPSS